MELAIRIGDDHPLEDTTLNNVLGQEDTTSFQGDGFAVLKKSLFAPEQLELLRNRLDAVLRCEFDTKTPPTKLPKPCNSHFKLESYTKSSPSKQKVPTLQIININHADTAFQQLCRSPQLGAAVAKLAGWEACGVRFAQDQVWVKPPGAGPLVFHRDTTYFDFAPKEVVTVWITFDSLVDATGPSESSSSSSVKDLGPLEYCHGSHRWSEARTGSANQFFDSDYRALLHDAAKREGLDPAQLQFTTVVTEAGGCAVHDGRTWHGSGPNITATTCRRGIGLHFIRADAVFCPPEGFTTVGKLWQPYVQEGTDVVSDERLPVVFPPMASS